MYLGCRGSSAASQLLDLRSETLDLGVELVVGVLERLDLSVRI